MTNSNLLELFASSVFADEFHGAMRDHYGNSALVDFLRKSDPAFPQHLTNVYISSGDEGNKTFFLEYDTFAKMDEDVSYPLTGDAAVAAATFLAIKNAKEGMPRHFRALEGYARESNPFFEAIKSHWDAEEAFYIATLTREAELVKSAWSFFPDADLLAVYNGDREELKRLQALSYRTRLEAAMAITFMTSYDATHTQLLVSDILPEAKFVYAQHIVREGVLTKIRTPFSVENWRASLAHRAEMFDDLVKMKADPTSVSVAEWALKGNTSEELRKRSLSIPIEMRKAWFDASLSSFPTVKPADKSSLDFFHWTFYASVNPELHPELEEVFTLLPKAVRVLLVRSDGEVQKAMNDILLRSADALKLQAKAAEAKK